MRINLRYVRIFGSLLIIFLLVSGYLYSQTRLIESKEFKGIGPSLEKPITNVILIHGIGQHCIGYADNLISNLIKKLTNRGLESKLRESYSHYIENIDAGEDQIQLLRNGSCERIDSIKYDKNPQQELNIDEDVESIVLSQDRYCESIHKNNNSVYGEVEVNCHKLFVNIKETDAISNEYVTGFIRSFSTNLTVERELRIYEVLWSPATRWIKQSLMDIDQFNDKLSNYWLNRKLKSQVINASFADAISYLSDSGILIQYNLLQAFCLALANTDLGNVKYGFTCDKTHLLDVSDTFSEENNFHFITHSLGTRILFDTIGMLALTDSSQGQEIGTELINKIKTKFEKIGAVFPAEYTNTFQSEQTFASILNEVTPEFAKALKSIYVFTNQVPLLSANLTSPFYKTNDIGRGFQYFLELRNLDNSENERLQIVSFHDPDDILSYNLECWYYQSVLKEFEGTKILIDKEAKSRAVNNNTDIGDERSELRKTLFQNNCESNKHLTLEEKQLYSQIWGLRENRIDMINVGVRLKSLRFPWIIANPKSVHSNYFTDETIHEWLAIGN